ncbi:acyl-CoA N-acyltransferase [Lipomyces japonicus]|uniref:acyl-CoA N-acyltransferase n=1 Tax=Lipomyces japonicus TaxID=56871 RepID=UPI0034CE023E
MTIVYRKYKPPQDLHLHLHLHLATQSEQSATGGQVPAPRESAETDLTAIRQLISSDLSEPYGIYVYRYFIYQWPHLCFLAFEQNKEVKSELVGAVVCKLATHRDVKLRGYIAMLAVATSHRGKGIATNLVTMAIEAMISGGADEIALETEVDNAAAMRLYENMGFIRSKRMNRYYMNANDAYRLILPINEPSTVRHHVLSEQATEAQNMDLYL